MAGKPTIPDSVHERIRRLISTGKSKKDVQEIVGCSSYTVYKAIDPDFVERERARCRKADHETRPDRSQLQSIRAYKQEHADTDAYREASRVRMATLRSRRRGATND